MTEKFFFVKFPCFFTYERENPEQKNLLSRNQNIITSLSAGFLLNFLIHIITYLKVNVVQKNYDDIYPIFLYIP